MSHLAQMLGGAGTRLLPFSVPYRFFMAATLFHVALWGLLAFSADQAVDFRGGAGPVLAMLHMLTLGVFVMAAIGASIQILPVVTGQPLVAVWPAKVVSWTYIPGVVALLSGFASGRVEAMAAGGILVAVGLAVFAVLTGNIMLRTRGTLLVLRAYVWLALASLVGLSILGLLAIADFGIGFLPDHAAVGFTHLILAIFGFMGSLVVGYSHILVPMFALAPSPHERTSVVGVILSAVAVVLGVAGALSGHDLTLVVATVVGLGAVGVYLKIMRDTLAAGMRKNLGLSMILIKASWVMLPLALLVGFAHLPILFIFLALFGWLLTFLLGVLQRVIPFLAAMNASKGKMPRLSALADERMLKIHVVCHFVALTMVAIGLVTGTAIPIMVGAIIGGIGALFYVWFAVMVGWRLTRLQQVE